MYFLHTVKSSYENISKKELIDKIINKLNNYLNNDNTNQIDFPKIVSDNNKIKDILINNNLELTDNIVEDVVKFDPTTDIISWFKENFELTNNPEDVIKVRYIYEKFTKNKFFINMNRLDKRTYNKSYFVNFIETNKFFTPLHI